MLSDNTTKRQSLQFLIGALLFAFVFRLTIGILYTNTFDLHWYRHWAIEFQEGFFDCYARLIERGTNVDYPLDYPPVYLFFLWPVGKLYQLLPLADYPMYDMLAMKFFPILFDVLAAMMLYWACRRFSETTGLLAACLWALNPSAIFNCANWGQTDGMMVFLLVLALYVVEQGRPITGSVLFAVACLTKMQCLYFTPLLFFYLLRRWDFKKTLYCIGSALGTGIAVFIPFIIGGWRLRGWKSLLIPFEIYFGGFGSYPYSALNTYNLYGIWNLNWKSDSQSLLFGTWNEKLDMYTGGFTLHMLSTVFLLASVIFLAYVILRGRCEGSLWVGGFMFMQCVFMLTTRMHERYQFAVLPFALLAFTQLRSMRWFWMYVSLSLITFLNQFMLLIKNNTIRDPAAPWRDWFNPAQAIFSAVNLAIFAWGIYETWRFAFDTPSAPDDAMLEENTATDTQLLQSEQRGV